MMPKSSHIDSLCTSIDIPSLYRWKRPSVDPLLRRHQYRDWHLKSKYQLGILKPSTGNGHQWYSKYILKIQLTCWGTQAPGVDSHCSTSEPHNSITFTLSAKKTQKLDGLWFMSSLWSNSLQSTESLTKYLLRWTRLSILLIYDSCLIFSKPTMLSSTSQDMWNINGSPALDACLRMEKPHTIDPATGKEPYVKERGIVPKLFHKRNVPSPGILPLIAVSIRDRTCTIFCDISCFA